MEINWRKVKQLKLNMIGWLLYVYSDAANRWPRLVERAAYTPVPPVTTTFVTLILTGGIGTYMLQPIGDLG